MGRLAAIDQRGLGHAIRGSGMTFRGTGKRCSMKGARRRCLVVLMFLLANVVVIATGRATAPVQEKPPEKPAAKSKDEPSADKPSTAVPATVKVEKGPFKVEVTLTGVFESARMSEVAVKPKAWSMPLVVEKAVELGTPVKQGDILVELDREKIDKAIQDAEVELTLGELSLKHAEEELPVLEKLLPIDLAAAERAKTHADEDLARFLEIDRPNSEKMAQFSVKSAVEYLEYAKEELRQLEKMYRSKDLTEETEEIILRRTRFQVESSEFRLKEAELRRDATLKVELPRQQIKVGEAAVRQALDLQKARATLPLALNQKRLGLAKLKHDQSRATEKLAGRREHVFQAPQGRRGHGRRSADHRGRPSPADRPWRGRGEGPAQPRRPRRAEGPGDARRRPHALAAGPADQPHARSPRGRQVRADRRRRARP